MAERDHILDRFLGDASTPIEWASEDEKRLHFWHDDLHCPQPISPMWFDVGGWWLTCGYMFRRFGVPFGKDWVAKTANQYVMSAVVPRDPKEEAELGPYFNMVMPVYAERFLGWWKTRYLPEILRNFEFLDSYPDGAGRFTGIDDPARGCARYSGTPFPAALDFEPRSISDLHEFLRGVP